MIRKLNFIKNYKPHRFQKSMRFFLFIILMFYSFLGFSQNKLEKQISAKQINTISIHGNQIFNIAISTSKTDKISITSILDGEYQNNYQIIAKEENNALTLSLEFMSFEAIPDDKRNAHKVIAATLHLEIPEDLNLNIVSDIGSVDLEGDYESLFIELQQGQCKVIGKAKVVTINTFDGDINVDTEDVVIEASSNHGKLSIEEFARSNSNSTSSSSWKLTSINGNITVVKRY